MLARTPSAGLRPMLSRDRHSIVCDGRFCRSLTMLSWTFECVMAEFAEGCYKVSAVQPIGWAAGRPARVSGARIET